MATQAVTVTQTDNSSVITQADGSSVSKDVNGITIETCTVPDSDGSQECTDVTTLAVTDT